MKKGIDHNTKNEQMTKQIKIITEQLAKQEQFIQELSQAIQQDELEKAMTLLAANKEFVTSDFIMSKTGHMLASYLLESATNLLLAKYPFLHLSNTEYQSKKVFYIGSWYKSDTRQILYLNVNLNQNTYYSLDLQFNDEVLSEWNSMEEVKTKTVGHLEELEAAYDKAKKGFDSMYAEALVNHKQALEEAEEELEYLNTKMLKKQSDIDEIERQIKRERQIIEQIQEEPELYFQEAENNMQKLENALRDCRAKNDRLALVEALVKREKNEIAQHMKDYEQFITEINELSAIFGAKK